jgi:hypothetical protein
MSKADVSIQYIVAMILGIVVLLLAAYLIYVYIFKSPFNCTKCTTEVTAWCGKCYKIYGKTGWDGYMMDQKVKDCVSKCQLSSSSYDDCGAAFEFCKSYIPL